MMGERSGLFRAIAVALVPPILVGVILLLVEYGIFQNGDGDDPTEIPGNGNPTIAITIPNQAEPDITLSTASGPPGTELMIDGSGFAPGETVILRFHTQEVGRAEADGQGAFADVPVQVPGDWPFTGQFDIVATGQSSIASASRPFQVT